MAFEKKKKQKEKSIAECAGMAAVSAEVQETDLSWYWKDKRLMNVWGKSARRSDVSDSSLSATSLSEDREIDSEDFLARTSVLARGEELRVVEEERIQADARAVDLRNLSTEDASLLEMSDADMDAGMQRRLAVLFVAALQKSVSRGENARDSAVEESGHREVPLDKIKRVEMQKAADFTRREEARLLPPVEEALGKLELEARAPTTEIDVQPLSAPTPLDAPPDAYRRVGSFPSVKGYWKARNMHSGNSTPVPFFVSSFFPLRHSLAHKCGMHPAFLHPASPLCMQTEVLAENAATLARQHPCMFEFVEGARVRQVNATLALDDPSNALGFQHHLEKLVRLAKGRYNDFVLVLKHGQANVGVCSKEHAQTLDEDLARHAGIPSESVLIICSGSLVPAARELAQMLQNRMAERSARLVGRTRAALLEGTRKQLDAAEAHDSHIVMGCSSSEEIYNEYVEVEMHRQFPGLFGPYSRTTTEKDRWTEIDVKSKDSTDLEVPNRCSPVSRLLAFLDLLGDLGADYYFARVTRWRSGSWNNLHALRERTATSVVDKNSWNAAIRLLDDSVNQVKDLGSEHEVRALVVTNDELLRRDLQKKEVASCASIDRLLFFGPGFAARQLFFTRRLGAKRSPPCEEGYLNCAGRLFAQVPPLDLRQTELLAFAILWSPAGRDYLLPGCMDARHVLLGDDPRSAAERTGVQKALPKRSNQRCRSPPPPMESTPLDLALASLRAREVESAFPQRILSPLTDDDDSETQ